ncbi:hypothetical protein Hanom_Chr17g01568731 [Helianthus anomalus]
MATSPHSNPEVAGSSLARSQCPYGSGFTPRLRLAGWRSAMWDHLDGWEDRVIPPHWSKEEEEMVNSIENHWTLSSFYEKVFQTNFCTVKSLKLSKMHLIVGLMII